MLNLISWIVKKNFIDPKKKQKNSGNNAMNKNPKSKKPINRWMATHRSSKLQRKMLWNCKKKEIMQFRRGIMLRKYNLLLKSIHDDREREYRVN